MKLTVEHTGETRNVYGLPCRLWRVTDPEYKGVVLLTALVAVPEGVDPTQFLAELRLLPTGYQVLDDFAGLLPPAPELAPDAK